MAYWEGSAFGSLHAFTHNQHGSHRFGAGVGDHRRLGLGTSEEGTDPGFHSPGSTHTEAIGEAESWKETRTGAAVSHDERQGR